MPCAGADRKRREPADLAEPGREHERQRRPGETQAPRHDERQGDGRDADDSPRDDRPDDGQRVAEAAGRVEDDAETEGGDPCEQAARGACRRSRRPARCSASATPTAITASIKPVPTPIASPVAIARTAAIAPSVEVIGATIETLPIRSAS